MLAETQPTHATGSWYITPNKTVAKNNNIIALEAQALETSSKTVNATTVLPGASLTYTIILSNSSLTEISNVVVTDTLPVSLTYQLFSLAATSGNYGEASQVITWTGVISAGEAVTITFRATVSQTVAKDTSIVNSAVISSDGTTLVRSVTVYIGSQICNLTKSPGNPILSKGANGTWDDDDVWRPIILKEGSGYKMWYTGDDGVNPTRIGLATSPDGLNWTKYGGNPVLSPGGDGSQTTSLAAASSPTAASTSCGTPALIAAGLAASVTPLRPMGSIGRSMAATR